MSRLVIILYILICFEMGVFLLVLPWVSIWGKNYFVTQYPWIGAVAMNYFVRGAVSGIGLADIWLAVYEFWRYRARLGLLAR
jgi:hypothetical protein